MTDLSTGRGRRPRDGRDGRGGRRRHPAARSRIAAVGVGATSLFGLVAAMGVADALGPDDAPSTADPATATTPTGPVVVVVHHTPAAPVAAGTDAVTVQATTSRQAPVVLSARPEVQVVAPAPAAATAPAQQTPAPRARTSGSR